MVPIPVAGDSPASGAVLRPATTLSDRMLRSPLWPSTPVRNQTQTPAGSAVSKAPPTENLSTPPAAWASRRPVLAVYSNTTAPPSFSPAAAAYRVVVSGLAGRPASSSPAGRTTGASTAPVRTDIRSSVRSAPAHTDPAGPAAGAATSPGLPGTVLDSVVASVRGLISSSTYGRSGPGSPYAHR